MKKISAQNDTEKDSDYIFFSEKVPSRNDIYLTIRRCPSKEYEVLRWDGDRWYNILGNPITSKVICWKPVDPGPDNI